MGIAQKAFRVIDSCKTVDQLNAATRYVGLAVSMSYPALRIEMQRVLNEELDMKLMEIKG